MLEHASFGRVSECMSGNGKVSVTVFKFGVILEVVPLPNVIVLV